MPQPVQNSNGFFPDLHLEAVARTRLAAFWNDLLLGGCYWRLYHNEQDGAGVYLDGKKVNLSPDKLYLLPPNCGLRTWTSSTPLQLYLHFELPGFIGRGAPLLNELPLENSLLELLRKLEATFAAPDPEPLLRYLLALSLSAAAVAGLSTALFGEIHSDGRIVGACDIMREKLNTPLDVESLGRSVGMSENAFLQLFREQTGGTPYQYLLHLRYSRAVRLLESGALTIDEICDAVGVRDRFHFSRTFKKIYGTSPAEYRRNALGFIK